ncbi:septum formation initiator family protein [Macrococcus epidermidis]|uniref:Septum formation initiator family protein n=2 Tax=Staphylococcaceae TaxID=90964 RepID=A0A395G5H9_9STAP|nr:MULTISPECIES: septum formation initiator family protein [Macrococcus]MCG7421056.1 septum formation initiator family protein [Macrococcus epidermidis]MCH4985432.1 septum formation initiator family protein [Macrococcus sp. PK]RAI79018.1 septum formation initiator family protein [Macrococcus goetzii]RAK43648.1 septum formation initiator family protein [Macrococcus epidermidis]TDM38884.1 septum formation initiator family protein [Macrococcus goetzii]
MAKEVRKIENEYTKEQARINRLNRKSSMIVRKRMTVFGGILLAILLFLTLLLFMQMNTNRALKQEQAKQTVELEKLKDKEIALKERLKQLNSKEYIEKIARSEYFLSNDGEVIFKIPEKDKKKDATE